MRHKVLVLEDDSSSMRVLKRVIGKARLQAVCAETLTHGKHIFSQSTPESFLCAVVDYNLPDAPKGQAIDFAIASFLPVIVIADIAHDSVRDDIISKEVVDYIPKENAQVFEYLSRLLARLEKNKHIGVMVVSAQRSVRSEMITLLQRHNFITFDASDGNTAQKTLERHRNIRLVICDEEIEGTTTVNLIADIRRQYDKDELSIIGVSGDRQSNPFARFIKSGANDYLPRPYCHEEFFCRVMQNVEQIENIAAIRAAAFTDYLTGLPNRRHFFQRTGQIIRRNPSVQTLALLDLDHFKSINDNYGHDCGDYVLKEVANLLKTHFAQDIIARFGGEEFCVYLPETPLSAAMDKLQAFRMDLQEKLFLFAEHEFHCTVSIGLTCRFDQSIESMLRTADELLYQAKLKGRNCVVSDTL